MLNILSKMENTRTKNGGDLWLQELLDYVLYYICPDKWIMDFDCLINDKEPEDAYLIRLMITIFLPAFLISIDLIMIWLLTFCIKLFRRSKVRNQMDCSRLCNRLSVAFSMQMFFIYPAILLTLFTSLQCFESLDKDNEQEVGLSRMLIVPEI